MLPLPPAAPQLAPPAAAHVQLTPVKPAGNASATAAPGASLGPGFVATIVYVSGPPGVAWSWPSLLAMARSASGVRASVSVAESLPATGSATPAGAATVAVLDKLPMAEAAIVPVSAYVSTPPGARSTECRMLPEPLAGQLEPALAEHVQVTPERIPGTLSVTLAAGAVLGPALVTLIWYVTGAPGTAVAWPSVLVTARSAWGVRVSVSEALLFAPFGSLSVGGKSALAVLVRVPMAVGFTVPVIE